MKKVVVASAIINIFYNYPITTFKVGLLSALVQCLVNLPSNPIHFRLAQKDSSRELGIPSQLGTFRRTLVDEHREVSLLRTFPRHP